MEFIYQFSIYKGVIHKLGEQVEFHCLPGVAQLVAPSRTPYSIKCTEQEQPVYAIKNSRPELYSCASFFLDSSCGFFLDFIM